MGSLELLFLGDYMYQLVVIASVEDHEVLIRGWLVSRYRYLCDYHLSRDAAATAATQYQDESKVKSMN